MEFKLDISKTKEVAAELGIESLEEKKWDNCKEEIPVRKLFQLFEKLGNLRCVYIPVLI